MYPLLEIKTVPIEIQVKTRNASLERTRGTVEMEISRSEQGTVDVKSRPIQMKLDTFEPRGIGSGSPAVQAVQASNAVSQPPAVQQTPQITYQATSAYAQQGQIQLNARMSAPLMTQNSAAPQTEQAESVYQAPFSGGGEWDDGSVEIRYDMDKLKFDWKIEKGEFKFTPGDIEFTVKQRPSVTIKYVGGPIYVPRSSDPNYRPVDVQA